MGSSLSNDSVLAHHISRNLIQAAQPLFATGESELAEAVQDVFLDDRELMKIAKRTGT